MKTDRSGRDRARPGAALSIRLGRLLQQPALSFRVELSDVPRVWWSHLAGQMMLQTLKEASVPRSYPAEFRRKVLDLVEADRPVRQALSR